MTNRAYQVRSRLEKLQYIHSTLQDMGHIFGVEDDMLTRSIKHVEVGLPTFCQCCCLFIFRYYQLTYSSDVV